MPSDFELVTVGLECLTDDHDGVVELDCSAKPGYCACPCHYHPVKDGGLWRGISRNQWVKRIMKGAGLLPDEELET